MSRLTIDTGTEGNPATGDSLRGAFTKVNTNFAELYAELGGDSLDAISFTNNTISTDITNANLILTGNGTGGVVIEDIEITGSTINVLTTNNNLTLNTNGTGKVIINGLSFPTADGTAGQVLKTDGAGNLSFTAVDPGAITFVGDDSTGTAVNIGETFKIAGTQNITTAISGDTLTITGPNLNNIINVVGDDSTGVSLNKGETIKIAGGTGLTSAVSGDTITLDIDATVATLTGTQELTNKTITFGSNTISGTAAQFNNGVVDADFATLDGFEILTNKTINTANNTITGTVITLVGDDSTGTAVNIGETFKIAGSGTVTTAVSGDIITITGATADLGDFTFSGNKLSTTSSNADMELDTAGTGNLILKSGNFLPATDNTQYLGSADKRWHTLYVGPGSININGVSITESGGKISLGNSTSVSGTLEVNEITSSDSSAIQINDAVNISGALTFHGAGLTFPDATTQTTAFAGNAATVDITNTNGIDTNYSITFVESRSASQALRGDVDLTFNSATNLLTAGNIATNTIVVNELSSADSSAIQINDGVNISGTLNAKTIVTNDLISEDSTAINVLDGMNVSGTLSADVLDVNEISSSDSSAIQINDNVNISGNITAGILKIDDGVHEKVQTKNSVAGGTVEHDCSAGHIFYHITPQANWTVNLTNLNLANGYATAITIVIEQGATGRYPSAVQINGDGVPHVWQGNTTPTPSNARIDVVTFSIINDGLYTVLGQLTGF